MAAKSIMPIAQSCWDIYEASRVSAVRGFDLLNCGQCGVNPLWRELELRPGLRVSSFEADLKEGISFRFQKKNTDIDFGFFLEGSISNELQESSLGPIRVDNFAGKAGIGSLHEVSGVVKATAGGKARVVHLHIEPEQLHELLFADMDVIHNDLKRVLENGSGQDMMLQNSMDPAVQAAANELFCSLGSGNCSRIFLEGKALELIGLQVMKNDASCRSRTAVLTPREIEQIKAIHEELILNYESPPSMTEFSRNHMLGVSKIQAGFQEIYGMTVFAYLKEYKLRKAKLMFDDGDMNVSEVAWELGYTNISHFSAAFKKRYGVLPKKYLSSIRGKRKYCIN
ncbi:AraC family transcriptional regulator [Maridesulfovibrio sp.]|uniref:AraC family transcriptional regulator n=1 Tax=Maridesulfovibrio sp. TaxID=2795000 RepID=UPI002AA82976|nr:AraC family transcriptional regulator [Maridesulfovibrio sp.]